MPSFSTIRTTIIGLLLVWPSYYCARPGNLSERQPDTTIAFPGAMGGGMYTTGGRGGQVIKVTNLHDSGEGSFREAIETEGTRTIVFNVSGTIALQSRVNIRHGNLTIAGQTAPGDGICIKGHEVRLDADNIIIRYLRFRPGDIAGEEYDALTGIGQKNIIIDHCSMSWSTDETVSFYDNEHFTLQWCIISESLNHSVHSKGAHGYGGIWGGKNASFHHNLLAHHNSRNPRLQGARSSGESALEKAEIIYNIIYNWGNKTMYGGENGRYNIMYNQFIPGPASSRSNGSEILEPYEPYGKFYLNGNLHTIFPALTSNNWMGVSIPETAMPDIYMGQPFPFAYEYAHQDSGMVYHDILAYAGASFVRDAVDERIVREVKERSFTYGNNGIIDSQNETESWPLLQSLPALLDTDGDGIPDTWEIRHGLDPNNALDGNLYSLNSNYTNLEMYLNEIVSTK
jgi:hypothetical protein